jgi:hypothetical protein
MCPDACAGWTGKIGQGAHGGPDVSVVCGLGSIKLTCSGRVNFNSRYYLKSAITSMKSAQISTTVAPADQSGQSLVACIDTCNLLEAKFAHPSPSTQDRVDRA